MDKTAYVLEEVSTILVTLKDKYGVNVGSKEGRLFYLNLITKNITLSFPQKAWY